MNHQERRGRTHRKNRFQFTITSFTTTQTAMIFSSGKPAALLAASLLAISVMTSLSGCQREQTAQPDKTAARPLDPAAELDRAQNGDARAQFNVGMLYLKGEGVPQDYKEARFWFEKAARHGLADAQTSLATLYRDGLGTSADLAQAMQWFEKAAQQGNADAQIGMARLLLNENLSRENMDKARQWLEMASSQGTEEATRLLSCFSGDGHPTDLGNIRTWLATCRTPDQTPPDTPPAGTPEKTPGTEPACKPASR